jgi:hypothetical protein
MLKYQLFHICNKTFIGLIWEKYDCSEEYCETKEGRIFCTLVKNFNLFFKSYTTPIVSHLWCDHFYRLLYSSTRHIEEVEGGERDTQLVHVNEATAV